MPKTALQTYFNIALSVDCVIFGFDGDQLKVLLRESGMPPYKGQLSLLGDLVSPDQDLDEAASKILLDRTGLSGVYLEQVKTFGKVDRHPLGRVITTAYYSLINIEKCNIQMPESGKRPKWYAINEVKEMAFDHIEVLKACDKRLKQRVRIRPIGFELLPKKFTLTQLQLLYEAILGTPLDKRNFRKKIQGMNLLVELKEYQRDVAHRPARLHRFDARRYKRLQAKGFVFEL